MTSRYDSIKWDEPNAQKVLDSLTRWKRLSVISEDTGLQKETCRVYIDALYRLGRLSRVRIGNASQEYEYTLHDVKDVQLPHGTFTSNNKALWLVSLGQRALEGSVTQEDLDTLRDAWEEDLDTLTKHTDNLKALLDNPDLWKLKTLVDRLVF